VSQCWGKKKKPGKEKRKKESEKKTREGKKWGLPAPPTSKRREKILLGDDFSSKMDPCLNVGPRTESRAHKREERGPRLGKRILFGNKSKSKRNE